MRIIKLGLISIIAFALIITGISLFFPSNIRISKAIDIQAPADSVRDKLADPTQWMGWYPGADSMNVLRLLNKPVGLVLADGNGVIRVTGKSDSTVTAASSGPGIREMKTGWNFFPAGVPNTTTVQWYMDFHLRWYPWEKFSSMLLEKRYGPTMEQGLDKLKTILEKEGER